MIEMSNEFYLEIYNSANENAEELLEGGLLLLANQNYGAAYVLGFSALEEIVKGQWAADVYTGMMTEEEFKNIYMHHDKKQRAMEWMRTLGNSYPYNIQYKSPHADDFELITALKPRINKRHGALYVDVKFKPMKILTPKERITYVDANAILHLAKTALIKIQETTGYGGMQVGSRGFMK